MEYIQAILNIPILQAIGIVFLIGIAERIGIPVVSMIKSLLKINGNGKKIIEQKLDIISDNHLEHIENKLEKLIELSQKILYIVEDLKK